jgi:hypothetical protein
MKDDCSLRHRTHIRDQSWVPFLHAVGQTGLRGRLRHGLRDTHFGGKP